jgi:fructokinase
MTPPLRIGIDLGGTKIEGIALDRQGMECARRRVSTPADDAAGTIQAIADMVTSMERDLGSHGTVGIGTPGALSPATGLLRNSNSICLNGLPLDRMLSDALQRPIRIANDANCFAISEATDGAASDAETVFGVILGTGVGGGVVIGRRILTGRHAIAGEWGHNPLPWPTDAERPGAACYCGRHGCIETFLSGPGLAAQHFTRTGETKTSTVIAAEAAAGVPVALLTMTLYADQLARALATVINLLDPDVIVLGGGLSNVVQLYDEVPARWGRYVFSDVVTTRLVPPKHGDASGVRGAAWLWA